MVSWTFKWHFAVNLKTIEVFSKSDRFFSLSIRFVWISIKSCSNMYEIWFVRLSVRLLLSFQYKLYYQINRFSEPTHQMHRKIVVSPAKSLFSKPTTIWTGCFCCCCWLKNPNLIQDFIQDGNSIEYIWMAGGREVGGVPKNLRDFQHELLL